MDARDVITLDHVSLRYRLAKHRIPSFKEYAVHWMRGALAYEELWALTEVSLRINRGESVGIIGRNGAGKSTLLKVISRVLEPTRGRLTLRGSVVPMLELGAGFDLELTGLENMYLNAMLLGRARADVDHVRDAIIEFSGLGDFIRAPIRNYSSGMLARLGFSVATAWVPDIFIVDEVLAVGDAAFLQRSKERMRQIRDAGSTLLLVSHSPDAILGNCERCVWLERGRVRGDGPAGVVLQEYLDVVKGG
jgi:ABC-2 type transport system ATP-binding protein/lipopolysaccharide transport system ATP-binding protein